MILKAVLKPLTGFSEFFNSDQIWGQFIWAISDLYGQDEASGFVEEYINGRKPILFSSLMIDGFLPKPFSLNSKGSTDVTANNKRFGWLSYDDFIAFQKNPLLFANHKLTSMPEKSISIENEVHASISRDSFSVIEGGLYNSQFIHSSIDLAIYFRIDEEIEKHRNLIVDVLSYLSKVGLGGDRNNGHGQFDISICDVSAAEDQVFSFSGNGFVSISSCFGKDLDALDYAIEVRSGYSGPNSRNNGVPRKKTIAFYKPGSVFASGNGEIAIGTCGHGIHTYGLSFPIEILLSGEEK